MSNKYKKFFFECTADKWLNLYRSEFPQKANTDETFWKALSIYTGSGNGPINQHLRCQNPIYKSDYLYPYLQSLLARLPEYHIPDNIVVYRFINSKHLKKMCPAWPPHKGMIISDKAFLSTTLLRHGVDSYKKGRGLDVTLIISIPCGTAGTYVGYAATSLHEFEILLPPEVKLHIDSFCNGTKEIFCTVTD